jgi:hypothetical protein
MPDHTQRMSVVELAKRCGDGLEVALNWSRRSGRVWVEVLYVATGVSLEIDADPAQALDYYYHPFAYCPTAAAA